MRTAVTDTSFTITRDFAARCALVWEAWTRPDAFMQWWGPKDYTAPFCRIDLRVGGTYLNAMRGPRGTDVWTTGVYREIVEPERIVYTDSFADKHGHAVPATAYGMGADFPLVTLVTVTLEDTASGTRMTMTHAGIPEGRSADDAATGWAESFEKLATSLNDARKSATQQLDE